MLRYKAGYKYVDGGVHAQVLDFPAAITSPATWPRPGDCWGLPSWTWPRRQWNPAKPYRCPTRRSSTRRWTSRSRSTCTCWPVRGCGRCRLGRCREAAGFGPAPPGASVSSASRGSGAFGLGQPGERAAECRASPPRDRRIHGAGDLPPARHSGAVKGVETPPNPALQRTRPAAAISGIISTQRGGPVR